jgi:hypothetical protein
MMGIIKIVQSLISVDFFPLIKHPDPLLFTLSTPGTLDCPGLTACRGWRVVRFYDVYGLFSGSCSPHALSAAGWGHAGRKTGREREREGGREGGREENGEAEILEARSLLRHSDPFLLYFSWYVSTATIGTSTIETSSQKICF